MRRDDFPKIHLLFFQRDVYLNDFAGIGESSEVRPLAETLKEFFTTLLPGTDNRFRSELTRLCLMQLAVQRLQKLNRRREERDGGLGMGCGGFSRAGATAAGSARRRGARRRGY